VPSGRGVLLEDGARNELDMGGVRRPTLARRIDLYSDGTDGFKADRLPPRDGSCRGGMTTSLETERSWVSNRTDPRRASDPGI